MLNIEDLRLIYQCVVAQSISHSEDIDYRTQLILLRDKLEDIILEAEDGIK